MAKIKTQKKEEMKKNNYPGKFIVLDGLDGSGQSTQLGLLRDFLSDRGIDVLTTKEPTVSSEAGKKIKKVLEKEMETKPGQLQDLFIEDRRENLEEVVIPALKRGKFVLCDRYFFSTFAYGAADGLNMKELIKKNDEFLLPDIAFIFIVSARTCIMRIERRGTDKTLFEKEAQLSKVLDYYKKFPQMFENVVAIDGERPIEEVFEEIKSIAISKLWPKS